MTHQDVDDASVLAGRLTNPCDETIDKICGERLRAARTMPCSDRRARRHAIDIPARRRCVTLVLRRTSGSNWLTKHPLSAYMCAMQ